VTEIVKAKINDTQCLTRAPECDADALTCDSRKELCKGIEEAFVVLSSYQIIVHSASVVMGHEDNSGAQNFHGHPKRNFILYIMSRNF
jgi:hypothetical protein